MTLRLRRRPSPLWAGAALLGSLLAPPLWALSLDEAVRYGLAIHPQVAAARAEWEAANTEVAIARDGYWPSLQASAGPEGSLTGEFGYDLTATQMLYDWGRVSSQVQGASAAARQQLEAYNVTRAEAALDIVEAYLDVLLFEALLAAAERHIKRLEVLAAHSRGRSGHGYVGRGELERAELELTRAREQFSMEKGALIEARMQFRELLDLEPKPEDLELPTPKRLTERLKYSEVLEAAIVNAPLFRQAEEEVEVARAEHEESRASLKPQLNLEGSLQRREIGGRMQEDAVIALRLRVNVFQGPSNFRRVEVTGRRIEAAKWGQRATRRDLRRAVNTLLEQDEVLGWRLKSLEAQLSSAKQVSEAYQEQFEVGLRNLDDLLPIQRDLFEVERQLSELKSQQIRIQYRVATKLGWLGELLNAEAQGGYDYVAE